MYSESFIYYYNLLTNYKYLNSFLYSKFIDNKRILKLIEKNFLNYGITKPNFVLSFDCDTLIDAKYVCEINEKLLSLNINPIYAVPVEIIEESIIEYTKLVRSKVKFMNHGFASHTNFDSKNKEYKITLNYNDLSEIEIYEDILKADKFLQGFLDKKPDTFRTPHFGFVQSSKQIEYLHKLLLDLGYKYSSSTNPFYSLSKTGYPMNTTIIKEFPLSGMFSKPLSILDSWKFIIKNNNYDKNDFIKEIESYLKYFNDFNPPFVFNLYVDPSHVYNFDDFFSIISKFQKYNVRSYSQIK